MTCSLSVSESTFLPYKLHFLLILYWTTASYYSSIDSWYSSILFVFFFRYNSFSSNSLCGKEETVHGVQSEARTDLLLWPIRYEQAVKFDLLLRFHIDEIRQPHQTDITSRWQVDVCQSKKIRRESYLQIQSKILPK